MESEQYDSYIESLRQTEFPQLLGTTYLDNAGTTLYPSSLIGSFAKDLQSNLFGNPHSASPSSHLSSVRISKARSLVLDYFNADPASFDVIFTANATAAIKLVREAFVNSARDFVYGYHRDCHTSIVGLRESARDVKYFESDDAVETWIGQGAPLDSEQVSSTANDAQPLQLFAYPAQSNLSGHRCPLTWPAQIRTASSRGTFTLLDAASYLTTSRLSLTDPGAAPDFVCCSFYKIFGFPDLGALIVNKSTGANEVLADARLRHDRVQGTYFGGGTVDMIINSTRREEAWFAMKNSQTNTDVPSAAKGNVHDMLEDGTLPFHSIVALEHAFRIHEELFGGAESIRMHTALLIQRLYEGLNALRYDDGRRVVEIYRDAASTFGDPDTQGPVLAFNVVGPEGGYVGKSEVERAAIAAGIQLRTGGVCNPGGIAAHLDLRPWEMRRNFSEGMRCGDDVDVLGGKATGVVRVSLGPMSCGKDIERFVAWTKWWFVDGQEVGLGQSEMSRASWEDIPEGLDLDDWPGLDRKMTGARGREQRVEAIEGLAPAAVLKRRGDEQGESRQSRTTSEALEMWEKEWVIVSLEDDGRHIPIGKGALKGTKLRLKLLPEDGILRIIDDSATRKQGKGRQVAVSLWDAPIAGDRSEDVKPAVTASADTPVALDTREADTYPDPRLREFFTAALGGPCTLARYRSRLLHRTIHKKTAWDCTKAGCQGWFPAEEELLEHYRDHVAESEVFLAEEQKPPEVQERVPRRASRRKLDVNPRVAAQSRSRSRMRLKSRSKSRPGTKTGEVVDLASLMFTNSFWNLQDTVSPTVTDGVVEMRGVLGEDGRKKQEDIEEREVDISMGEGEVRRTWYETDSDTIKPVGQQQWVERPQEGVGLERWQSAAGEERTFMWGDPNLKRISLRGCMQSMRAMLRGGSLNGLLVGGGTKKKRGKEREKKDERESLVEKEKETAKGRIAAETAMMPQMPGGRVGGTRGYATVTTQRR